MARLAKVSYEFVTLTPGDKVLFGHNVITELTEHVAEYPTPDVPLAVLESANDDLIDKIQKAANGDKEKIQERDLAEQTWISVFRAEAAYVQRIAGNNKLLITKSGYQSTSTDFTPRQKPAQATLDAWGNKTKGSIHAEITKPINARGHVFIASLVAIDSSNLSLKDKQLHIAAVINQDMKAILTTKRKVDFQGLVSGQTYYIAALGFNATGVGDISFVISVVAP